MGYLIAKVEEVLEEQKKTEARVDDLETAITRYKGFVGGVVFLGSCLVTAVGFVISFFKPGG